MSILSKTQVEGALFFDIETALREESFLDVNEDLQDWFTSKMKKIHGDDVDVNQKYQDEGGFYVELNQIVCITCAFFNEGELRVKGISGGAEKEVIEDFIDIGGKMKRALAGHNIENFDIPQVVKKLVMFGIPIPRWLYVHGVKPWEKVSIDTMEIWKMGPWGGSNTASLNQLCLFLGVPTPKDDIDGSQVSSLYHKGEIERIVDYCNKDVIANVRCGQVMAGEDQIKDEDVIIS